MKYMRIWIAAVACVSVLAGAQAAVAGEQTMIPAQWREHRFPVSAKAGNVNQVNQVQNPANDPSMTPAHWRVDRFQAMSNADARHQADRDQTQIPAQWREDRFDASGSMADARDHGREAQDMTTGSC